MTCSFPRKMRTHSRNERRKRKRERCEKGDLCQMDVDCIKYDDVVIIYCHVNHIFSLYLKRWWWRRQLKPNPLSTVHAFQIRGRICLFNSFSAYACAISPAVVIYWDLWKIRFDICYFNQRLLNSSLRSSLV